MTRKCLLLSLLGVFLISLINLVSADSTHSVTYTNETTQWRNESDGTTINVSAYKLYYGDGSDGIKAYFNWSGSCGRDADWDRLIISDNSYNTSLCQESIRFRFGDKEGSSSVSWTSWTGWYYSGTDDLGYDDYRYMEAHINLTMSGNFSHNYTAVNITQNWDGKKSIGNCTTRFTVYCTPLLAGILDGLPSMGTQTGGFLRNISPGLASFIVIIAVLSSVAGIVAGIAYIIRKKINIK